MANAPKLELKTNIPCTVRIKKMATSGKGEYGEWFLWIVDQEGVEKSFFANQYTQPQLLDFNEGDEAVFLVQEKGKSKITTITPVGDIQTQPQNIAQPRMIDKVKNDKETHLRATEEELRSMSIKVQSLLHIPSYYDKLLSEEVLFKSIIERTIKDVETMDEVIEKHLSSK